jgi:hypothetical protein
MTGNVNNVTISAGAGNVGGNVALGTTLPNIDASGGGDAGQYNVGIGESSLTSVTAGNYNTAIGYLSDVVANDLNNSTSIGYNAKVSSSNTFSFGNNSITKWVFGIPTTTNIGYAFQVGSSTSNGNGAYLTNGGTWTNASSRDFKEHFEDIDGTDLLDRIEKMNVQRWTYKGTDEVHIGPIAEEFKSLFNLGVKDDNKHISTLDASGIALKAIQELNSINKKLIQENVDLKAKYSSLEQRLMQMELLMNSLTDLQNKK